MSRPGDGHDSGDTGDTVADAVADADDAGRDADVHDRLLADALDVTIGIAAAGAKLRPPLPHPPALRSLFRFQRLPPKALTDARAAIHSDPVFRARVGAVVSAELVGEAGLLWLRRPPGWRERLEVLAEASVDEDEASLRVQLRRAERRREAAERAAEHALAELAQMRHRSERSLPAAADDAGSNVGGEDVELLRAEIGRLKTEARHAGDRLRAATERADRAAAESAAAGIRAAAAERLRDELLAERSRWAATVGPAAVDPVPAARPARRARRSVTGRRPLTLPGGIYGTSFEAADHLLRTRGVVVLVDGYNVAKLGWPTLSLEQQRERCVASAEDIARRYGADIRIVFDGDDVPGAAAPRRTLVAVSYSPAGVTADDVLRAHLGAIADSFPVIVATDDREVVADSRAAGANVLTSRQWLDATGHRAR